MSRLHASDLMSDLIEVRFRTQLGTFRLETDLQLPASGITVFFGHSGCGKTSLLRCIAGLERPEQGFLQVRGEVWQDSSRGFFLPTYQRPLGYVFQEASLFPHLSVRKNLGYGQQRIPAASRAISMQQSLQLLGIEHLLERMPEHLSGGERQRVAIARALALSPRVLLMDEPLAALDLQRKEEILPYLQRLQHELDMPILYVTHSPQEVTRLADYLVALEDGKVITAGPLEDSLTRLESPLARGKQASTVLHAEVCGYEEAYDLIQVRFPGGVLSLPYRHKLPMGSALRVRVYARDVSLTLQRHEQTSILNRLPAIITGLVDGTSGQVIVRLSLGGVPLLSHITRKSADLLGLREGLSVFAQIKATAIL